jgi:abhydrolase domain-containing protein 13
MTQVTTAADSSMSSTILSWIILGSKIAGGIVLTLLAILYTNQEKMLYMPNPPGFPKTPSENPVGYQSPATWSTTGRAINSSNEGHLQAIEFEDKFVETSDGVMLHTWLLLHPNSSSVPTLIYFHGNAGNMGFLLKNAALMFARANINVLLMDYRGYGKILVALRCFLFCLLLLAYVLLFLCRYNQVEALEFLQKKV